MFGEKVGCFSKLRTFTFVTSVCVVNHFTWSVAWSLGLFQSKWKLLLTLVRIVFHCFSIWEPTCNVHWHFLVICLLRSGKTLKKHAFTEHRLRLLTRPVTLSWGALEVDPGWEVALPRWQESLSLSLQGCLVNLHQATCKRPLNLHWAV